VGLTIKNREATNDRASLTPVEVLGVSIPRYPHFLAAEWADIVEHDLLQGNAARLNMHSVFRLFSAFTTHRLPEGEGITYEALLKTELSAEEFAAISRAVTELVNVVAAGQPSGGENTKARASKSVR
jgi:hypothetical protein